MARQTVFQTSPRVITRERGVIPGCIPVGKDDHMVILKPDDIDAYCAKLQTDVLTSRAARGACMTCGEQPLPKRPLPGKRYCKCPIGQFKAEVAA